MTMILPPAGLSVLIVFWTLLFAIDWSLKRSKKYAFRYVETLKENGFTISICHLRWQTPVFNKFFMKISRLNPKLLFYWFNLGAALACISMVTSVVLLSGMLYKSLKEKEPEQILQPVMPGMNLPWNQIFYYVFTLVVAGIFHEVGHAIAANRENVRVESFGVFVLFVYPGAFVELHTDQLEIITPIRKLRIYAAGVWHNFVLAIAAYFFLCVLPYVLLPFYTTNQGAAVTWISQESSIYANLPAGDVITSINDCSVRSVQDWYECLHGSQTNPVKGYCNSEKYVRSQNTSLKQLIINFHQPDCCNDSSAYRFCFHYRPLRFDRVPTADPIMNNIDFSKYKEHACLPARTSIAYKQVCLTNRDCSEGYLSDMLCLKPLTSNTTKVIKISHLKGQDVLFVGDPVELMTAISLSNYVPKSFFWPLNLPEHLRVLSMYLLSISSALVVLNMVPCVFLDGHKTLTAVLELLFPRKPTFRSLLESAILFIGSLLLALNIIIALHSLVR